MTFGVSGLRCHLRGVGVLAGSSSAVGCVPGRVGGDVGDACGGPVVFDEDDGVAVSEGDPVSVPCGVDDVSGQGMGDQEVDSPETDSPVGADSDLASPLLGEAPRVRVPRPAGLLG